MNPDIIAAIDEATGCQQCGKPLERSVSDDFCGEGCQQAWHAKRVGMTRLTELSQHAREGDRITAHPPSGAAQSYVFASGRWERVWPADALVQPSGSFATPADFRAALGWTLGQLSRIHGVPRELLGFNVVTSDEVDPPNSVHIRGNGSSYIPGVEP